MNTMVDAAIRFHDEGLSVIPIVPGNKKPILDTWEKFQVTSSSREEIDNWWAQWPDANIGIVNGPGGYVTIDIDHDAGIYTELTEKFPQLVEGRIERSGSGEGYHIPLKLETFPDFGFDSGKQRPRGNRQWHTPIGDFNIRCRWCQTVAPPSLHPSGNRYVYLQEGALTQVEEISMLVKWLDKLDPRNQVKSLYRPRPRLPGSHASSDDIKRYFSSLLELFSDLGVVGQVTQEPDGQFRIRKNGGLIVDEEKGFWYHHTEEMGGDAIDAVGWSMFGQLWDRHNREQYRAVMDKMMDMAGLGTVRRIETIPSVRRRSYFKGA